MNLIKKLLIKYKELIVYGFFGVMTTVINFVSFEVFNRIFGDEYYLLTNVLAWLLCVIFAYVTNKLFVFESKSWNIKVLAKELSSFFAVRIFSFVIEEAGLFALVDLLGMESLSVEILGFVVSGKLMAKIIVGFIVVVINYFFSKLVIFKKKAG